MHDLVACDLCERTILKGERIEVFVAGGDRRRVCELCTFQAIRAGWSRESALEEHALERERLGPRRSLWSRAIEWAEEQGLWGAPGATAAGASGERRATRSEEGFSPAGVGEPVHTGAGEEPATGTMEDSPSPPSTRRSDHGVADRSGSERRRPRADDGFDVGVGGAEAREATAAWARRPDRGASAPGYEDLLSGRRREPREISAVPTSRDGKLERALELFNASEHRRPIAGIARALGEPWVSVAPLTPGPAAREVGITVAWELSWYRYRVDLDDADQAVLLLDRGDEIDDLDEAARGWNAGADIDGHLALALESVP